MKVTDNNNIDVDKYSLENAKNFARKYFSESNLKSKHPNGGWIKVDDILSVLDAGVECGYKFGTKSKP